MSVAVVTSDSPEGREALVRGVEESRLRGQELIALAVVDANGTPLMPCGRCRQLLLEHGGPELLVDHPAGPRRLADLLPDAFGPDDLARVRS